MSTDTRRAKKRYGEKWRVLAHRRDGFSVETEDDGQFDELVLEDILHLEQMDNRRWWMRLGDARFGIYVPAKGKPQIFIEWASTTRPVSGRCLVSTSAPGGQP